MTGPDPAPRHDASSDDHRPGSRGRVLVTGASIAGPAAAYWLARVGYEVTVLERTPEPRRGGQNIDVRGLAREVLDRMDLTETVRAAGTGEVGTRFLDEHGKVVSQFEVREGGGDGPTAELEVLRGELARVLVEACDEQVTWWSGDQVAAVRQDDDGVEVRLAGGAEHRFDLLVVAEGAGSRTRGLLLDGDDAPELRRLGMYMAWATIPRTDDDDQWWSWLGAPGSRMVSLRPDNTGTTRALLGFMSDPVDLLERDADGRRAELRERFGDLGWQTPRVLDAIDDLPASGEDLYLEDLTQVLCPRWSVGRVVLLGDAAWCVTPIGGAGTSLALVGAYVLAAELGRLAPGASPAAAFAAYDAFMRPLVDDAQHLPPGTPRLANPRTRLGLALFHTATRIAATRPVQAVVQRLGDGPGPDADLELPAMPDGAA